MFNALKKLLLIGLIGWGLFVVYQKFVAPTTTPFFEKHKDNVDFFGAKSKALEKASE